MKRIVIFIFLILGLMGLNIYLYIKRKYDYLIVFLSLMVILIVVLIVYIYNNKDSEVQYRSELKRLLKVYDPILVEVDNLPSISNKNIVRVVNLNELLDAQAEIRKPIYYKIENGVCSFVIVDTNMVCAYILKDNESKMSSLEDELKEDNVIETL